VGLCEQVFYFGNFRAPRPVGRLSDEAGADGVHPDVIESAAPVVLVANRPGGEALAEEGSDAVVDSVVLAGVRAVRGVQGFGEILSPARDDRVVVRSHEAVRIERDRMPPDCGCEQREEEQSVRVGPEKDRLVHRVGRDVEEAVRERRAEDPGHDPQRYGRKRTLRPAETLPTHFRHAPASLDWCLTPAGPPGSCATSRSVVRAGGRPAWGVGRGRGPASRRQPSRSRGAGPAATARARPPRPRQAVRSAPGDAGCR
jgi:hypothetical protein